MSIDNLKQALSGDHNKDTRLNLAKILSADGAPALSDTQRYGTALASAYVTKNETLIDGVISEAAEHLTDADIAGAKLAATLMAMNNVYYRFTHLVGGDYANLPANLRMMGMANPGIDKVDFELYSLAVSAINGCGMCMESHAAVLEKAGLSNIGVQSAIRIAAVIRAADQGLFLA